MGFPNFALIPLSLLVFGGGAELAARAVWPLGSEEQCIQSDPITIWSYKSNCHDVRLSLDAPPIAYDFDACGHRNIVPCGDMPIAALGDSFTVGHGVRVSEAFVNVAAVRAGTCVDNFAVEGSNLPQYYERMPDVLATKPKVIVLGLFTNDFFDDCSSAGVEVMRRNLRQFGAEKLLRDFNGQQDSSGIRAKLSALFGRSRLAAVAENYLFASDDVYREAFHAAATAEYLAKDYTPDWQAKIAGAATLLKDMNGQAMAAGARFIVVLIPHRIQAILIGDRDYDAEGLYRRLREAAPGIEYVDFFDTLRTLPAPGQLYFPTDRHLTPEGHRLLGEQLAAHLR